MKIRSIVPFFVIVVVFVILAISCKKGNDTNNPVPDGTVKDIDGNVYHTVTIGTQVWMVENLKTTKYLDGSPIPIVTDNTYWGNLTTGAYCNYDNDVANGAKYGKLYNWYAATNSKNLAPTGWHIPTNEEWITMENYLIANGYNYDGTTTNNKLAKALAAKTDWAISNEIGAPGNDLTKNNLSGFTAFPGGARSNKIGTFEDIGVWGYWWSSTEGNTDGAWDLDLGFNQNNVFGGDGLYFKSWGFSVRCIKN